MQAITASLVKVSPVVMEQPFPLFHRWPALYNLKCTLCQGVKNMEELTIGEVARRTGLQTSAIRYYESVGVLPPSRRVNERRRYDSSIFQRLGIIQLARQAGFRISELQ